MRPHSIPFAMPSRTCGSTHRAWLHGQKRCPDSRANPRSFNRVWKTRFRRTWSIAVPSFGSSTYWWWWLKAYSRFSATTRPCQWKVLNIAPPGHEAHFDALRDYFNTKYDWSRPDDISLSNLTQEPNYVIKLNKHAEKIIPKQDLGKLKKSSSTNL